MWPATCSAGNAHELGAVAGVGGGAGESHAEDASMSVKRPFQWW
jgi:hypothetical protein